MDINEDVINDDQDLAKALAGISTDDSKPEVDEPSSDDNSSTMPTPMTGPQESSEPVVPTPIEMPTPTMPTMPAMPVAPTTPATGNLDDIKKDALSELRPLVDKLSLEPQEMFDTYLLLIRSTDDKALIAPAHAAAQKITDESKKAQALLEIVKEIDYLSNLA